MKFDWWTLALQTINVLVLLWVLQRFLFKPVLALIERRQQATQAQLVQAQEAEQRAEQTRTALEAERGLLASSREQALADLQVEVQSARETLLAHADQEAREHSAAVLASLHRERAEVEEALRAKAATLAGEMARRLLERLPAGSWHAHFIDGTCEQLTQLSPGERELLRDSRHPDRPTVVSAQALSAAEQASTHAALNTALGHEAAPRFSVDASLIAGVELRFHHLVVRNHWAADLELMLQSLHADDDTQRHA